MSGMTAGLSPDGALGRLRRAGWSEGDIALASGCLVCGTIGENQILAVGDTQGAAWRLPCERAAAVEMLAPGDAIKFRSFRMLWTIVGLTLAGIGVAAFMADQWVIGGLLVAVGAGFVVVGAVGLLGKP
jgi:hypothetical protein